MFTGIVQAVGRVADRTPERIAIQAPANLAPEGLQDGESLAVNGCCLTVLPGHDSVLQFDTSPETNAKTSLGDLKPGDRVNIERAMRPDSMFGGHIVQGHVDCTARLESIVAKGNAAVYTFSFPPEFGRYIIEKGSVTVDGISLTATDVRDDRFSVWVIPHTLENTNLSSRRPGDRLNLEFDMIAKYVEKMLRAFGE